MRVNGAEHQGTPVLLSSSDITGPDLQGERRGDGDPVDITGEEAALSRTGFVQGHL